MYQNELIMFSARELNEIIFFLMIQTPKILTMHFIFIFFPPFPDPTLGTSRRNTNVLFAPQNFHTGCGSGDGPEPVKSW